jgi:hypothetical protein
VIKKMMDALDAFNVKHLVVYSCSRKIDIRVSKSYSYWSRFTSCYAI